MVINALATCLMAYSSDYNVSEDPNDMFLSPIDNPYENRLIEHKVINEVYDVYLFFVTHNCYYIGYICSKDESGEPLGWEILEYPIAVRLFPMLKEHKSDYAEFISS